MRSPKSIKYLNYDAPRAPKVSCKVQALILTLIQFAAVVLFVTLFFAMLKAICIEDTIKLLCIAVLSVFAAMILIILEVYILIKMNGR